MSLISHDIEGSCPHQDYSSKVACESSYQKYSQYYSKNEMIKIGEMIDVLKTKEFTSFLEICEMMQAFFYLTKYNLKRNCIGTVNSITFVCSCISKKQGKTPKLQEVKDSIDSYDSGFLNTSSTQRTKRKMKRENVLPCTFRVKYKLLKNSQILILKSSSRFDHNHPPQKKQTAEQFAQLSRNIKFSFRAVLKIIYELVKYVKERKIVDSGYLKSLRNEILFANDDHDNPVLRSRYSKKLIYFIKMISTNVLKCCKYGNEGTLQLCSRIIKMLVKKNAATYLRFEDLEKLFIGLKKIQHLKR